MMVNNFQIKKPTSDELVGDVLDKTSAAGDWMSGFMVQQKTVNINSYQFLVTIADPDAAANRWPAWQIPN